MTMVLARVIDANCVRCAVAVTTVPRRAMYAWNRRTDRRTQCQFTSVKDVCSGFADNALHFIVTL